MGREVQLGEQARRHQDAYRRRRAYQAQRLGWATFGLILVAAIAGLIGPGPLSWTSASSPLVDVEYERFTRWIGDTSLEVTVRPDPAQPDTARLWISADYLERLKIQQVVPEPASWTAVRDGTVLAFTVDGGAADVTIQVSPDRIGPLRGELGAPGRPPVGVWQFVYP